MSDEINPSFCENSGEKIENKEDKLNKITYNKDPVLAALSSLIFVCLGQFYNGQILKGMIIFIAFFLINQINGLLALIIVIYSVYDAYTNAKNITHNNGNYFYNENLNPIGRN